MAVVRLKALVTFNSEEYGKIRAGERFWSEPGYAKSMVNRKNCVLDPLEEPQPQHHAVVENAPSVDQGKEPATGSAPDPSPEQSASDEAITNGSETPASASRPVRRSRKRT